MKQRVRTRILAVLMTAMMILTLTPTVYADDENPSKQISVTAAGPTGMVIGETEKTEAPDLFRESESQSLTAEIDRDYDQTVSVPLTNTTDKDVSFYMTVENPNADLSMNFVGRGYSEETCVFLAAGESTTMELAIFAQEAEAVNYNNIKLFCHVPGYSSPAVRMLELTVRGEGLQLTHSVTTLDNGDLKVTITNQGAAVNSLKVTADDTLAPYVFFPTMITNYVLDQGASVSFTVSPGSNVEQEMTGNLLAKGNGAAYEIPITLSSATCEHVSGLSLLKAKNILADVKIDQIQDSDDGDLDYSLSYDEGTKALPATLRIDVRNATEEDILSDDQTMDARIDGFRMNPTRIEGNKVYYSFTELYTDSEGASLMDGNSVQNLLAEYEIEIDLENSGIDPAELSDLFDAAVADSSRLSYIDNLPNLPQSIRDEYTASLQLSILLDILSKDTEGKYDQLKNNLSEKLKEFYPDEEDPIAALRKTLKKLEASLEKRILRNPEYADFKDAIKEDQQNESKIDRIKKEEKEHPSNYSQVDVKEDGQQCTNRGEITSSFYGRDTYSLGGNDTADLSADEAVTAADKGIRVYYSGRIVSEDRYINFEQIRYDLYLNGEKFGSSENSGLSEINIIELDPELVKLDQVNTFTRDYDVNPGTHFINTDNRFTMLYPSDAVLQMTDASQVKLVEPDFDVYRKNIFVTDQDGNYVDSPITGSNDIHVSVSNRGAHGGYFTLSITDQDGNQLLSEADAKAYHYLPAFTAQTLTLRDVNLRSGSNSVKVEIQDCSGRTKETVTDNNRAEMEIDARDRQVPVFQSLSPNGQIHSGVVSLTANLDQYRDVREVNFYLDGSPAGTSTAEGPVYSVTLEECTPGEHTFHAEATYDTGGTSSRQTETLRSETSTFIVPGTSAWADVIFPAGTKAADYRTQLMQFDGEQRYYSRAFNAQIRSEDGSDQLYVPENENPEGTILIAYDRSNGKLYAGTVGSRGTEIRLAADRTLTLTDAVFAYSDLDVYLGNEYYDVTVEPDSNSVRLPAVLLSAYGSLKIAASDSTMWINMGEIDLRESDVSYSIGDSLLICRFTVPESSYGNYNVRYLYSYTRNDRTYYGSLYGDYSESDQILTTIWNRNEMQNLESDQSWISIVNRDPRREEQGFIVFIDPDQYTDGMSVLDQAGSVLSFTAEEPSKLDVQNVSLRNEEKGNSNYSVNLNNTSNKTIACTPGKYTATIGYLYDGNAYTTTQTVDLSASRTVNLSASDLSAKLQVNWAEAYGQNAEINLRDYTAGGNIRFSGKHSGDEISVAPGEYSVNVSFDNYTDNNYSEYGFSCGRTTAQKGETTVLNIGDMLSGNMYVSDDYDLADTYNTGDAVEMRLSDLRDSDQHMLNYQYGNQEIAGYVFFTPADGEGGTVTEPVTLSSLTEPFTVKLPDSAGVYNLSFSTSLLPDDRYVITGSAGTGGSISPSGAISVASGDSKTFTITANAGYRIHDVKIDGISAGTVSSYTFTDVDRNHTITAEFMPVSSGGSGGTGGSGGAGSGTALYNITLSPDDHGTLSAKNKAAAGNTVSVTATPDSGYIIENLLVEDQNGNPVPVQKTGDHAYTFKMPGTHVTVTGVFRPENGQGSDWANPYRDVSDRAWYYPAVEYVTRNQLMNGIGDSLFDPEGHLSRAMLAQILYNKEGRPENTKDGVFTDVDADAWYADAVNWAAERGFVEGYGNGRFGPDDRLTREQLATILWRYKGSPDSSGQLTDFTDADQISSWAMDAMKWAVQEELIHGKGEGILDPAGHARRCEVAQIFMNGSALL